MEFKVRSKSNINKIKILCEELNDRDRQLKVNAKTLWLVLDKIERANEKLKSIMNPKGDLNKELSEVSTSLEEVKCLINERGCKKVSQNEH